MLIKSSILFLTLSIAWLVSQSNQNEVNAARNAVASTAMVRHDTARGSGALLGNNGYVVTAYHAVKGAGKPVVRVEYKDMTIACGVIRSDRAHDLSMLLCPSLKGEQGFTRVKKWVPLGTRLLVTGYPGTVGLAVGDGIVAGKDVHNRLVVMTNHSGPGGSGGPVTTLNGKLIGVVHSGSIEPPLYCFITDTEVFYYFIRSFWGRV